MTYVRCRHILEQGHECQNVLCSLEDGVFTLRKRGRIISFALSKDMSVNIVCEKCGGATVLRGDK